MPYETLQLSQSDAVATVTLNRPAKRNASNAAMFEELDAAFSHIATEPSIRSFVLTGAGGHFCSGVDLSALEELPHSPEEMRRRMERIHAVLARLMYCPKPGVAPTSPLPATSWSWATTPGSPNCSCGGDS